MRGGAGGAQERGAGRPLEALARAAARGVRNWAPAAVGWTGVPYLLTADLEDETLTRHSFKFSKIWTLSVSFLVSLVLLIF